MAKFKMWHQKSLVMRLFFCLYEPKSYAKIEVSSKKGEVGMEQLKNLLQNHPLKWDFCFFTGVIGGAITYLFGGWTTGMQTLVIAMVIDYITGLLVAGVFKNSAKTEGGGLKSDVGFKGLVKKFVSLMIVSLMYQIDKTIGFDYLRDLCIIGFILNELISITENAGLMGIPLPPVISKAIEILNRKAGGEDGNNQTADSQ